MPECQNARMSDINRISTDGGNAEEFDETDIAESKRMAEGAREAAN
jgi:hypothetical protein